MLILNKYNSDFKAFFLIYYYYRFRAEQKPKRLFKFNNDTCHVPLFHYENAHFFKRKR